MGSQKRNFCETKASKAWYYYPKKGIWDYALRPLTLKKVYVRYEKPDLRHFPVKSLLYGPIESVYEPN